MQKIISDIESKKEYIIDLKNFISICMCYNNFCIWISNLSLKFSTKKENAFLRFFISIFTSVCIHYFNQKEERRKEI